MATTASRSRTASGCSSTHLADDSPSLGVTNIPWPTRHWYALARRRMLKWYAAHRRDLPWRATPDPYRVWISEIMLQQTQVATVREYFKRFVVALPDVHALAEADERQVLRLWEGLGYYRRARQLHRAAQVIMDEHGGRFPARFDEILSLPGIGRYTAGAISSIAFDRPAPILEANTVRLFSRLLGLRGDATSAANQTQLWRFASEIVPARGAGTVNQALMELGSLICTPTAPKCDACPLRAQCSAAAQGQQSQIPAPKRRPLVEEVREATLVIWQGGSVLVRQRSASERWAGMWDFPRFSLAQSEDPAASVVARALAQTGVNSSGPAHLTTIKHGVTRFRITLECFESTCVASLKRVAQNECLQWRTPSELESLPLSVPARKIARLLARRQSEKDCSLPNPGITKRPRPTAKSAAASSQSSRGR